jgi:mRNA interferase RelE/StbE
MTKISGNETYTVKYLKNVTEKEIPALPGKIKEMVQKAIRERLKADPVKLGKPLCSSFKGQYRIRISNYRVIYTVNHLERKVLVTRIGHRSTIYKK